MWTCIYWATWPLKPQNWFQISSCLSGKSLYNERKTHKCKKKTAQPAKVFSRVEGKWQRYGDVTVTDMGNAHRKRSPFNVQSKGWSEGSIYPTCLWLAFNVFWEGPSPNSHNGWTQINEGDQGESRLCCGAPSLEFYPHPLECLPGLNSGWF